VLNGLQSSKEFLSNSLKLVEGEKQKFLILFPVSSENTDKLKGKILSFLSVKFMQFFLHPAPLAKLFVELVPHGNF
jgi:hypothetical protein